MVWVGRFLEILHVAARAGGCRQVVIAVGVAISTLQPRVSTCNRKAHRGVIETRRLPRGRAMAVLAGLRKSQCNVIRIRGFPEVRRVTSNAVGGRAFVLATHVATQAVERGMGSGQGVAGDL